MPKKPTKKKSTKESSDTLESDMSSSESEVENEQEYEDNDNDVNDSDIEEEDDEDYDDNDDIGDDDSIKSAVKEEDKDEDCFFTYPKEEEIDLFDEDDFDTETQSNEVVAKDNRISINRMSLYEFVRLIGTRTKQLSMGAKPMIKNHKGLSSKDIAIQELKNNTLPLIIKRPMPDNKFELWKINELEKSHLFDN